MARKNGGIWVKAYMEGRESMRKEMEQQNKRNGGGCASVIILMMGFGGLLSLIIKNL